MKEERTTLKERTDHSTLRVGDDDTAGSSADESKALRDLVAANASSNQEEANLAKQKSESGSASSYIEHQSKASEESEPKSEKSSDTSSEIESDLSNLSNETLVAMAMHPDTPEAEWVDACAEIDRRKIKLPVRPPKRQSKYLKVFSAISLVLAFILGIITYGTTYQYVNKPTNIIVEKEPYHLISASGHYGSLQRQVTIQLGQEIEKRGWSNADAAKYFNVSEDVIDELRKGDSSGLSFDNEIRMLLSMDAKVTINIESGKALRSDGYDLSKKDNQAAIEFYTRAIAAAPNKLRNYVSRGDAYAELNQNELALADYTKALQIDPKDEAALNNRVNTLRDLHRYDEALRDANSLVGIGNLHYMTRGLVYQGLGQYEKALADHTKAIQYSPQRPGPYCNRANTYESLGKYKEALADWERCLAADSTYEHANKKIKELKEKYSL